MRETKTKFVSDVFLFDTFATIHHCVTTILATLCTICWDGWISQGLSFDICNVTLLNTFRFGFKGRCLYVVGVRIPTTSHTSITMFSIIISWSYLVPLYLYGLQNNKQFLILQVSLYLYLPRYKCYHYQCYEIHKCQFRYCESIIHRDQRLYRLIQRFHNG